MVILQNNKLIFDYINGEYIENIDELENDYKFMMKVISVTNDKNMYNLCSDVVKRDYEFIKFMIETFRNDKEFINKIALEYLDNVDNNDITARELIFIMSDIFNKRNDNRAIFYNAKRCAIYDNEMIFINNFIHEEYYLSGKNEFGLGFIFVLNTDWCKSDIAIRYFAKRLLDEIFYLREDLSLEDLIHMRFSNLNKLKLLGIKNFILEYVKFYDEALSNYLFVHIDLIKDIERDIINVVNNWDNYLENILERKNLIFRQEVNDLISKYEVDFDYSDICSYIDSLNLNLPIKLSYVDDEEGICFIDLKKISLNEYKCLQKIIKLAKDLYFSPVIDEDYNFHELDEIKSRQCGRILKFNSKDN